MNTLLKGVLRLKRKKHPSRAMSPVPSRPIDSAFKEYIRNEIPARFIDTSSMQFVSRKGVFHVFQDQIANVTDEQIQKRIWSSQTDPLATYQPRYETVLRQTIQETVKYVVLSHRWDEVAGEPTHQDIFGGKQTLSKFTKLAEFCRTSKALGYKLAWVDTCCIDKTNTAELSEAIHGMYKWYAHSHTCIAYLSETTSYESWGGDPWFTRCWILQELIASKRLKFYGKNWQPLISESEISDDRKVDSVIPHLQSATGIPKDVLAADNSLGVEGRSFWEIMSWASKRNADRVEDKSYCLIGLFRVSLPITYGEGQRAFSRLIEAIVAKNPSWDIFAWSGQPSFDHFALPSSPASYPRFEANMMANRVGVQQFTMTAYELWLKSLPLISMELRSYEQSREPGKHYLVYLGQQHDDQNTSGRFRELVVECGATRLKTIREARQLSACIINHHTARSREQGKLVIGMEYICFLLYRERDRSDGSAWMKLATDNLLRISCWGITETKTGDQVAIHSTDKQTDTIETDASSSPLVMTHIKHLPLPPNGFVC